MSPDVSIVLCTWNRCALLREALEALVSQQGAPAFEVVVVDNASTDATADVVSEFTRTYPHVQYVREPQQGLSFARNTGIRHSRGALVAFTDDDVRVSTTWVGGIAATFARERDAAYAGGPVLPRWGGPAPAWLTQEHWAPLGIQDYGSMVRRVDADDPICLIGANLIVRRSALDAVGGFDPAVQRQGDGPGSTEDQQWQLRAWAAGHHGIYDPALRVSAVVGAERVTKGHHRTWHYGHGRHVARMHLPEIERSRWRPLGVPAHLLRRALGDVRGWLSDTMRGDRAAAFAHEARLCFTAGFLRERLG